MPALLSRRSRRVSSGKGLGDRRRCAFEALEPRTLLSANALADVTAQPLYELFGGALSKPSGYTPAQVRHAYGFDQLSYNGAGQTIAIVDAYDAPNIVKDLQTFDTQFGLAAPPSFSKVNQTGGTTYPAANASWALEISLDVEWAHAIAPKANILLVEAKSASASDLYAAVDYAALHSDVVSMSFGMNESSTEAGLDAHFTGHPNVTFVASSGDRGGVICYPSVSPYVLAVGGTTLKLDSAGNYVSEAGWSGSGGGVSRYEAKPAYQSGVSYAKRAVPDVAYNGDTNTGFPVYDSYRQRGWVQVGGTSAGTPQWAALVALADQGRGSAKLGTGQVLATIYSHQGHFHDVTTGKAGSYTAGVGFDLVTGLGSPYANLIVSDLVATTSLVAAPTGMAGAQAAHAGPWAQLFLEPSIATGSALPAGVSMVASTVSWANPAIPASSLYGLAPSASVGVPGIRTPANVAAAVRVSGLAATLPEGAFLGGTAHGSSAPSLPIALIHVAHTATPAGREGVAQVAVSVRGGVVEVAAFGSEAATGGDQVAGVLEPKAVDSCLARGVENQAELPAPCDARVCHVTSKAEMAGAVAIALCFAHFAEAQRAAPRRDARRQRSFPFQSW